MIFQIELTHSCASFRSGGRARRATCAGDRAPRPRHPRGGERRHGGAHAGCRAAAACRERTALALEISEPPWNLHPLRGYPCGMQAAGVHARTSRSIGRVYTVYVMIDLCIFARDTVHRRQPSASTTRPIDRRHILRSSSVDGVVVQIAHVCSAMVPLDVPPLRRAAAVSGRSPRTGGSCSSRPRAPCARHATILAPLAGQACADAALAWDRARTRGWLMRISIDRRPPRVSCTHARVQVIHVSRGGVRACSF